MSIGSFVSLARELDRLLTAETRLNENIAKLDAKLDDLQARVIRLENREDLIVVEARGAASAAASQVTMTSLTDLARRIGILEERSGPRRLV